MDGRRFDDLTRAMAARHSRRALVHASAAVVLGGLMLRHGPRAAAQQADPPAQPRSCAKQRYDTDGTNFRGEPIDADTAFFDALDDIDACAGEHGVGVHVTSSLRDPDQPVRGAIVPPARTSNHHVGHAIDMNVVYTDAAGREQLCDAVCLDRANRNRPREVTDFIECVRDAGLRWGGDFRRSDPVHIDDGLNLNDRARFRERADAIQNAVECSTCDPCNLETGLCEDNCASGRCDIATGTCGESDPCANPTEGIGQCR